MSEEDKREAKEKHSFDLDNLKIRRSVIDPRVFEISTDRQGLKKSKPLKALHELIQKAGDCGLITRQEIVSMLPVKLLKVEASDLILDMCAAPGSKTSQILEIIEAKTKGIPCTDVRGGVIANDMSSSRAWMLAHQIKRINTACMAIINHAGQQIPSLIDADSQELYDKKFYFDKVLADVPCTGDGAIRKLPMRWRSWSTKDAINVHQIQISLLVRAIQLAKVGGTIAYSTCSLNPIENEAVLAAVLTKAEENNPGALVLEDIGESIEGLKVRRGLTSWPVLLEKKFDGPKISPKDTSKPYTSSDLFDEFLSEEELKQSRHSSLPSKVISIKQRYSLHKENVHFLPIC